MRLIGSFLDLVLWIVLLIVFFSQLNKIIDLLKEIILILRNQNQQHGKVFSNVTQYKVYIDGKIRGGYTAEQLKTFSWFTPKTYVCFADKNNPKEGDWEKAVDFPELQYIFGERTNKSLQPPPPPSST